MKQSKFNVGDLIQYKPREEWTFLGERNILHEVLEVHFWDLHPRYTIKRLCADKELSEFAESQIMNPSPLVLLAGQAK